ncbi:MAG: DUF2269 domain-containing protein [Sandaracinaceae bacterium]|nr:DUF2269 domain-containing protein [Sandaracinaceae bacterium]
MTLAGKATIVSNLVVLGALGAALAGVHFGLWLSYELHKILHILGAVLVVGNLSVGPLWIVLAWRTRDPKLLGWAAKTIAWADLVFTLPGIHLLLWNGLALASVFGGVNAQPWLFQTVVMLVVAAIFAPTVVLYYQEKLIEKAEALAPRDEVNRWLFRWSLWGSVVMLPFGAAFFTMVAKHGLW